MIGIRNIGKYWARVPNRAELQVLRTATRCVTTSPKLLNIPSSPSFTKGKYEPHIQGARHFRTSSLYYGEIKMVEVPPFAESITEGDIRWMKEAGDSVAEDEPIAEIETDKTSMPVNSPCAGVIQELLVEDGSTVTPGKAIAKIEA